MKRLIHFSLIGLLTFSCALFFAPAGAVAQQTDTNPAALTLKVVKDRLKQNQQYIKQAKKSAKANDPQALNTAITNYNRNMDGLNTALNHGGIQGSPSQQQDAYNRVQNATKKHIKVLRGLRDNPKIPEQGRAGIIKALDASTKEQTMALSHLSQLQTQQQAMRQAHQPGFGQAGSMGRSQGVGRAGSMGGMGAGMSNMGGRGMGGSMGRAGGAGMGAGGHGH